MAERGAKREVVNSVSIICFLYAPVLVSPVNSISILCFLYAPVFDSPSLPPSITLTTHLALTFSGHSYTGEYDAFFP